MAWHDEQDGIGHPGPDMFQNIWLRDIRLEAPTLYKLREDRLSKGFRRLAKDH